MSIRDLLKTRERAALSLVCVIAAAIWVWALWPRTPVLSVTFLSVGHGDSAVVRTPGGHTVLIDCGPGEEVSQDSDKNSRAQGEGGSSGGFDAGAKIVVPYLRREGVNTLDALVITHPHEDHAGGSMAVLQNIRVGTVIDSGLARPSGTYAELLKEVEKKSIPCRRVSRGDMIDLHDGVKMEVLNPPANASEPDGDDAENNDSVVLRITYGSVSFLMAGDAGEDAERDMMASGEDLSANVLKVGHHGSSHATISAWLSVVRPEIAVISVGYKNQFHHPSPAAVKRLEDAGVQVYRTDQCGGVTVSTDGKRVSVETARR